MKTITYLGGGPNVVSCGEAGQFTKGVPRDIEDDALADQLLGKNSLVFVESAPEEPKAPDAPKTGKQAAKQLEE